nr:MAG TPA: tail completion protein [Caudoviricetes sp.]
MDNVAAIIEGIARALHSVTSYAIYTDFHKQNARFPLFHIKLLESNQEQEFTNRYWRECDFDIQLFMDENGEIQDTKSLMAKADALYTVLEYIHVNGKLLRGTDMNYRVTDNVLHFFVSYNKYVFQESEPIPKMETLQTEGGVLSDG